MTLFKPNVRSNELGVPTLRLTDNVGLSDIAGMDVKTVIKAAGGPLKLALAIGRTHSTVCEWVRVPPEHVIRIEALTGIPRHELRPDVFPAPDPLDTAA